MQFKTKKYIKSLAVLLSATNFISTKISADNEINLKNNLDVNVKARNGYGKFSEWTRKNPGKSTLIGLLGAAGVIVTEEIIRRNFFNKKQENTIYGINKFGYNAKEDCVYKRKNGKINVVIIGSSEEKRKQFIDDIRNNKKVSKHNLYEDQYIGKKDRLGIEVYERVPLVDGGLADCIEYRISKWPANDIHHLCISEERAKFSNWNIIEKDLNNDSADEIADLLKNDVAMAVFMIDDEDNEDKIREIFLKSLVSSCQWEGDTKYNYYDESHSYNSLKKGPAYIPTGFIFKKNMKNIKNNKFDKITPINGMAQNFLYVLRTICDDGRILYNSKDHNYYIGRGFDS